MDGFEFTRVMKKMFPNAKIILMTAFILMKEEFELNRLDIQADDVIVKPFAVSHLLITIIRLLNMRAADCRSDSIFYLITIRMTDQRERFSSMNGKGDKQHSHSKT